MDSSLSSQPPSSKHSQASCTMARSLASQMEIDEEFWFACKEGDMALFNRYGLMDFDSR